MKDILIISAFTILGSAVIFLFSKQKKIKIKDKNPDKNPDNNQKLK